MIPIGKRFWIFFHAEHEPATGLQDLVAARATKKSAINYVMSNSHEWATIVDLTKETFIEFQYGADSGKGWQDLPNKGKVKVR